MAMCSLSWLLLLVVVVPFFVSLSPEFPLKAGGAAAGADGDKAALLAFKAAAISGGYDDPLASWNDSSSTAGGFCSWEGVTCRGKQHQRQRVVALSLHSHGLVGYLSPAIGNLSSLRVLNLSSNAFSGAIPASLGRLHHLRALDMRNNTLTGDLPANLTSCTRLTAIHLRSNQLQGRVPRDLGTKLMLLQVLNLRDNNLTGAIPASLANLSSLGYLDLSDNHLTGEIPPGLGGIQGLQNLDLAFNRLVEDKSTRVGDFGLSRILTECASKTIQNSNSMFGIIGSVGYVAPEYGGGSSVSTLGDVYSLSILLLELFTGKSPIDDMFRGSLDLHKFCKDALPKRIWEVADTAMWLHTATHDSTTRTRIESCLISAIGLGISCSEKQPRERIPIHDATVEMHAIRDSYLIFARPLEA